MATNYSGTGINAMLKLCKKKKLTRFNSDLHIKDPSDLNSPWYITTRN